MASNTSSSNLQIARPQATLGTTLIDRLPPEVLTIIFLNFQRMSSVVRTFPGNKYIRMPWLVVLRVCRRWKSIACGSPRLWSHISASYPPHIIKTWLQLSKAVPLVLELSYPTMPLNPLFSASISRVRRLKICHQCDHEFWDAFRSLLSSPAPLLESLSFDLKDNLDPLPWNLDELFEGTIPPLRHLSFRGLNINTFIPTTLTILEIRSPSPRMNPSDLLSVLQKLPSLRSLQMSRALQSPQNPTTNPRYLSVPRDFGKIVLPSLGFLSIHGLCYAQDLNFLSHLLFPSTTTLLFATEHPFHHPTPISALSDFLRIHTSAREGFKDFRPTSIKLTSLYARLSLDITVKDHMSGRDIDKRLGSLKVEPDLQARQEHQLADTPDVTELFQLLTSSTVTTFSTDCYVHHSVWPIISSAFPALREISLSSKGWDATILTSLIRDHRERPTPPNSWIPVLPGLRRLDLHRVVLGEDCQKDLVQVLQERQTVSSGLEELNLSECYGLNLNGESIRSLGQVQGLNVTWDQWNPEKEVYDPEFELDMYFLVNDEEGGEFRLDPSERRIADLDQYFVDSYMVGDV